MHFVNLDVLLSLDFLSYWTDSTTVNNVFILLNGCICLHGVRLSGLLLGFRTHLKSMHFHSFSFVDCTERNIVLL